jgi:diaminohydroxyphosphoribosylaminopyrimidine deaminase/5-amino-6-(5-phosphoribosylamino)uracil reductase
MTGTDDNFLMNLAINQAWQFQGLTYPNPAVGAVVIDSNGKILSIEAHQKAGTSHAEVLALIKAYQKITNLTVDIDIFDANITHKFLLDNALNIFKKCTIFVTLEPCSHHGKTPSCASLLSSLNIKKVVIATLDPIKSHSGGIDILKQKNIHIEIGIEEQKAKDLIEPFRIWQNRAFVLFKIAQTTNGKIGGGYLSSKNSLIHTHKLRDICDKMVIGGNTVRIDRPTLDCRYIKQPAPNLYIYSKQDNFAKDIPLFNIKDREVIIGDDLSFLDKPSFVLVEGGNGMINAIKDKIDWLLIYQTPSLSLNSLSYSVDLKFKFLKHQKLSVDLINWCRVIKKEQ